MNPALLYLWFALLRRKVLLGCRSLRRPTTLIGFLALMLLAFVVWQYRHEKFYAEFVRGQALAGGALLLLGGSLFRGFWQRGLTLEPPDIEFLFTSPFTARQILFYHLWSSYLFALVQGVVFVALFAPHLQHPLAAFFGITLFQVACFHVSTGASVFAGTLSDQTHHRLRCMLLVGYFLILALYLRVAWDLRIVPAWVSSPLVQLLFYPALTLPEAGNVPGLHVSALFLLGSGSISQQSLWQTALCLGGFSLMALGTLAWLLRLVQRSQASLYETSLATTTLRAEKRLRLEQGRHVVELETARQRSCSLPRFPLFRGVGAIIWKNLVAARRSRRELLLGFGFATVYTGFAVALLWLFHEAVKRHGALEREAPSGFSLGVALFLAVLPFFLQRLFPFDFRRDGHHLLEFRTLPVSALALALVEVAVPSVFCVSAQALGLLGLICLGYLDWLTLGLVLLAYPAIALALNGVWNLHYLLSAARRADGRHQSPSAAGSVLVVALSFLVFYPAGWTVAHLGHGFASATQTQIAVASSLGVQCLVDTALIVLLAWLFKRFEISKDSK